MINIQFSRRQALKGIGIGAMSLMAATRNPGAYLSGQYGNQYFSSSAGATITPDIDPDVYRHNSEIAQHILLNHGPEAVERLGFGIFLKNSKLENIVSRAGTLGSVAAGTYALSKTQYLHQLYDAALKLLHDIPITETQYAGKLSLLTLLGGTATACSNNSNSENNGNPTGPIDPTTGKIKGNVSMKDLATNSMSSISDSIIEFLDAGEKIITSANIVGGSYETQSIPLADLLKITRTRLRGKDGQPVPYLTRELNTGQRFNLGDNTANYLVAKRNPGIPELYNATNRDWSGRKIDGGDVVPPGLKRVDSDLTFWADTTGAGGRGLMDPVRRIKMTEDAVKYMYPIVTKRTFIPGENGTFRTSSNPPARDNNNVIINYDTQLGNATSRWKFNGYKLIGAGVDLSSPTPTDVDDFVESMSALLEYGESNVFAPSLANNNVKFKEVQPVDKEIIELSFLDALGTQKKTIDTIVNNTMERVPVDSWEPMI